MTSRSEWMANKVSHWKANRSRLNSDGSVSGSSVESSPTRGGGGIITDSQQGGSQPLQMDHTNTEENNPWQKEIQELKQKLLDRDKTIAATIKASSLQEKKIETLRKRNSELEAELLLLTEGKNASVGTTAITTSTTTSSSTSNNRKEDANTSHAILVSEYKETISNLEKNKQDMTRHIVLLKKQISDLKSKEQSTSHQSSNSSGTMSQLQKQQTPQPPQSSKNMDYEAQIQQRDDAISSLIKASITQEQQINNLFAEVMEWRKQYGTLTRGGGGGGITAMNSGDGNGIDIGPTWEEFHKVQQESEMFAGQIIELDEEVEELRQRLEEARHQIHSRDENRTMMVQNETTIQRLYASLQEEKDRKDQLEHEVSDLRLKLKKMAHLTRIQSELEEVEELNSKLEQEVRELRRKMRVSQLEAEKVPDLESELTNLRENLNKLQLDSTKRQLEMVSDMKTQMDYERAMEQRDAMESQLRDSLSANHNLEEQIKELTAKGKEYQEDLESLRAERDRLLDSFEKSKRTEEKKLEEINMRKIMDSQQMKIHQLENDIEEQNNIIGALTNEVKRMRSQSNNDSDANEIIIALTDEVKKLREKSMSNSDAEIIEALSEEVRSLRLQLLQLSERNENLIDHAVVIEMEAQIVSLKNEVTRLQQSKDSGENESDRVIQLKKELEEAEKSRTQFEKTMISNYERKLSLMQMNKDVTIDGLRKELTKTKAIQKESETDLLTKIRTLENEKREFEAELQAKMQQKNARIEFLEQHLSAHEQVSGHMREDLDQLQSRMENMSVGRRAEIEELQEDLMDAQSKITKYEREVTSLKMKVEEMKLQHNNEVSRLQNMIDTIEIDNQTPMMRDVARESEKRIEKEYQHQMESLRSKVNILQEENRNLKYEVEKIEKQTSRNDKWRNSALQEQVIKLQQRLKEYENENGSVMSSSSRRKSISASPRVPRSPASSFNDGRRDDLSSFTEES